ncbi:MAG: hypothetical protein LBN36_09150, partial [Clostridiales Family XIII bacterium]|nr:hypothetical protein [Clostridiales Family XIII bacterium]
MRYLLGADLGTTAIKVGLYDESGIKIATASEDYDLLTPSPEAVEYPAEAYWHVFKRVLKKVLDKANVDKRLIASFSISAQGETLVFLDENGKPLHNFLVWLDNRAQDESTDLGTLFPQNELHRATGQSELLAIYPCSKILWFKRHHPELFKRTSKILLIEDYFFYRL